MSGVHTASAFCTELSRHRIRYSIELAREGAIMVGLAVPGQRWEIEFLDDGTIEVERFVSSGVESCVDPLALVLDWYE